MPNDLEFKVAFNGRLVTVCCECDGYKPLGIDVYEENGDEIKLNQHDHDTLYTIACEKAAERLYGDR